MGLCACKSALQVEHPGSKDGKVGAMKDAEMQRQDSDGSTASPSTSLSDSSGDASIAAGMPESVNSVAFDSTLSVMIYFKIHDCFSFLQSLIDYQTLTKNEESVKYYGFSLVGGEAVCKEGYGSADGFLAHMENVHGPWQAVLAAAEIVRIDVHGPAAEIQRLREPLDAYPTSFWSYMEGAFFVPAKYVEPSLVVADRTLSVMVYWEIRDMPAFMGGVADFQALTKQEAEIKYYGFARNGSEAVCKEGYDSADGFLAHMTNVAGPWQAAIDAAGVARIEVHGPTAEVEKLRPHLKDLPVTYWGCADGAFFAPSRYVSSLTTMASPLDCKRRCFLKDTFFKTLNHQLVPAQRLQLHAQVCSSKGRALRVRKIEIHPAEEREVVEMRAGEASLTVTGSHRVVVQRDGKQCTAYAEDLQPGDDVLCNGGAHKLDLVRKSRRCIEVVEIVFDPDEPVEAFLLPSSSILTKGQMLADCSMPGGSAADSTTAGTASSANAEGESKPASKKRTIRRGGMWKRGKPKQAQGDDDGPVDGQRPSSSATDEHEAGNANLQPTGVDDDEDARSWRTYDPYE